MKETKTANRRKNRLNRNILECKVLQKCQMEYAEMCLNRNILECKVGLDTNEIVGYSRLNRNILECKELCGMHLAI